MSIGFDIKVDYTKALKILAEKGLFDGVAFTTVEKNYVLWNKSYLITTANEFLAITPYLNKNKPNTNKTIKIPKTEIENFDAGKIMKAFNIKLKANKEMKFSTTIVEYERMVENFNQWLKN